MVEETLTILIVEDDLNECEIYKNIVKNRENVKIVSITNSSSKAVEEFEIHNPDAVILDLELNDGEGSGFDFIEKIKELNNKMPKIVVTTNVGLHDLSDILRS